MLQNIFNALVLLILFHKPQKYLAREEGKGGLNLFAHHRMFDGCQLELTEETASTKGSDDMPRNFEIAIRTGDWDLCKPGIEIQTNCAATY